LKDFEKLCDQYGFSVVNRSVVNHEHKDTLGIRLLPNLFGQIAVYLIHNGNS